MNDPHPFDDFVFTAMLEHPFAERHAFLEHVCFADAALHTRIATLARARGTDAPASLAPCRPSSTTLPRSPDSFHENLPAKTPTD